MHWCCRAGSCFGCCCFIRQQVSQLRFLAKQHILLQNTAVMLCVCCAGRALEGASRTVTRKAADGWFGWCSRWEMEEPRPGPAIGLFTKAKLNYCCLVCIWFALITCIAGWSCWLAHHAAWAYSRVWQCHQRQYKQSAVAAHVQSMAAVDRCCTCRPGFVTWSFSTDFSVSSSAAVGNFAHH